MTRWNIYMLPKATHYGLQFVNREGLRSRSLNGTLPLATQWRHSAVGTSYVQTEYTFVLRSTQFEHRFWISAIEMRESRSPNRYAFCPCCRTCHHHGAMISALARSHCRMASSNLQECSHSQWMCRGQSIALPYARCRYLIEDGSTNI